MRKRAVELPAVTDGECTTPSHVVQVDACNGSLRSKRFQLSDCAKVRARAPPPKKKWKGEGERGYACPQTPRFWKRPLIFRGCRVMKKFLFGTFERRNDVLV